MGERLSSTRFTVMLLGALLVFLGGAVLANPGGVTILVVRFIGIVCLLFGAMALVSNLMKAHTLDGIPFGDLALAGALVFIGAMVAMMPAFFAKVLFSLFGVLIIISGLGDIARSHAMVADDDQVERMTLRVGIVTVAIGVFVTVLPSFAIHAIPIICGVALVIDGLSELFLALTMQDDDVAR